MLFELNVLKFLKSSRRKGLQPLGLAIISVKKIKKNKQKIEKGKIYKSILIRRKKNFNRKSGDSISFSTNAVVVLLTDKMLPMASRIKGPIL